MIMQLTLPLPPSANRVWRKKRLSEEAKEYYNTVKLLIAKKRFEGKIPKEKIKQQIEVDITVLPTKRHRRDLDNSAKALLDALTKAGVYEDDKQIKKMSMQFGEIMEKTPFIHIKISEFKNDK